MIKRVRAILYIFLAIQCLMGCTARPWYEGVKMGAQQECLRQATTSERQQCESRLNKDDYDTYQKKINDF